MVARILRVAMGAAPVLVSVGLATGIVTASVSGCIDFSDAFPDDPNSANTNGNSNTNGSGNSNGNTGGDNTNTNSGTGTNTNGGTGSNTNGSGGTNGNTTGANGGTIGNINVNGTGGGNTVVNTNGTGVPVTNSNTNTDGSGAGGGNTNTNTNGSDGGGTPTIPTMIETISIAKTGDPAPGQAATVTFTEFGNPVIDSKGRVAFWALYGGTGAAGFGGLYVYENGALKKVLDDNPASAGVVPGRPATDYFGKFQKTTSFDPLTQDVIWAGGDRLLFVSLTAGSGTGRGFYRWRATDSTFARIADIDQLLALYPDAATGAFVPTFGTPGVSDDGFAIFGMDYRYFTKPPGATLVSGQAIFTSNGIEVSIIRDTNISQNFGGDVPGHGADSSFQRFSVLTTLNPGGDMLFEGHFFAPDATRGLYLYRYLEDIVYRVIDGETGVTWPGLPTGAQVNPASGTAFIFANGPLGHIAVDTQLKVDGNTRDAIIIFDFATSLWYELTGPNGAPATDLISGVTDDAQLLLLSGGSPYIVGGGQRIQVDAALPAELNGVSFSWLNSGGSINNSGRAVTSYSRDGKTGLAYWTGQQLLVVADATVGRPVGIANVSTITDPRRDRVGRSGLLNDRDEIVFRATLTAGGQAIYLSRAK